MADVPLIDRLRVPWRPRPAGSRQPPPGGGADWRATIRSRIFVSAVLLAGWAVVIEARLLHLQVIQHGDLMAKAEKQQLRVVKTPAKRGEIVDRKGRVLAYSVDADTVFADPTEIEDPDETAAALCGALDGCDGRERAAIAAKLRRDSQFVYVARKVSPAEEQRVRELKLKGVDFVKESRRYYPNIALGAHLLGYVGTENNGLAGLEAAYDSQVRGLEGKALVQTG